MVGRGRGGVNPSPRDWGIGGCAEDLHARRPKASAVFKYIFVKYLVFLLLYLLVCFGNDF